MVLAAEEGYDRPSWWDAGETRADNSGQELQPLFCMKDNWDVCRCEDDEKRYAPPYGQLDCYGDPMHEYIFCPVYEKASAYHYDWREGQELTEEQATRWALYHSGSNAHHLFPRRKEETTSATLPASDFNSGGIIRRLQLSDTVGNIIGDIDLYDWQRNVIDNLPGGRVELNGVDISQHIVPGSIIVTYTPDAFFDGGVISATNNGGRDRVSMAVSGQLMEDDAGREAAIRRVCEQVEQLYGSGRRESGGADRGGQATA